MKNYYYLTEPVTKPSEPMEIDGQHYRLFDRRVTHHFELSYHIPTKCFLMQKLILSPFLLFLPLVSFSQAGLAFFSHERQIAVSTNFEKRLWGEFRLATKTANEVSFDDGESVNVRPWLAGHANIVKNSQVSLSLGLGIGASSGYYDSAPFVLSLPLAIRFAPFAKAKNVYFLGEFAPSAGGDEFDPGLSWGVRYLFLKD